MKWARPAAAEKLERGEALLGASQSPADVEKAVEMFHQASREAPESSLLARRECEALTALGKHDAAVTACDFALARSGKVLGFRATAAALMSGPYPPTPSEIGRALFYARRGIEISPDQPWGYAAECDIAAKLGDIEMLNACTRELSRIAKGHYEEQRASAIAAAVRPGTGVAAAWLFLAVIALGTIAHAVRRSLRRSAGAQRAAGVTALTLLAVLLSPAARADDDASGKPAVDRRAVAGHLSKYPIDEMNPESSVPTPAERDKDPLEYGYFLMDLGDAADRAIARGDHLGAARFYRALVKAVPDAAVSYRKTCEEYEAAGDLATAKGFCAGALTQADVTIADYSHYARVVFGRKGEIDPKDIQNLDSVVAHLKKDEASRTVAWDIECNLGVHLADAKRLRDCAPPWAAVAPNESKVIFFQWVLALHEKDYSAALRLLKRAKSASIEPERLRRMERATYQAIPFWRRGFGDWRFGAMIAVIVSGALIFMVRRKPSPGAGNGTGAGVTYTSPERSDS